MATSDVWVVPPQGRVVIDSRGNTKWEWPSRDDPFGSRDALNSMDASELRIVEPTEIHRCSRPWMHESERPSKEYLPDRSLPKKEKPAPGIPYRPR